MTTTTVKVRIRGSEYAFPGLSAWIDERASVVHVGLPSLRDATYMVAVKDIDALDVNGKPLVLNGCIARQ